MTVVAYKSGTMCSDSMVSTGSGFNDGSVRKIIKTPEGFLVGAAGNLSHVSQILDTFEDYDTDYIWEHCVEELSKLDEVEALLVTPDEILVFVDGYFSPVKADFYALGNGSPVAKGAMAMGATAEEATEIAIRFTLGCGGDIQKVEL